MKKIVLTTCFLTFLTIISACGVKESTGISKIDQESTIINETSEPLEGIEETPDTSSDSDKEAEVTDEIIEPLETIIISDLDADNEASHLGPLGVPRTDWGYDPEDATKRGFFKFDKETKSLIFERSEISGGAWVDSNFIPSENADLLTHRLGDIKKISVQIRSQININLKKSSSNGKGSMCGIFLGFGDTGPHANASKFGSSLSMNNRDWSLATNSKKNPRDYIRFLYSAHYSKEKFSIDAPINSYNKKGKWKNFTAASWREQDGEIDVLTGTSGLETAGDYLDYLLTIEFDYESKKDIYYHYPTCIKYRYEYMEFPNSCMGLL